MEDILQRFVPLWGRWNVDQFLGAGSFGTVWKVSCPDEPYPAAVKAVRIPFSPDDLSTAAMVGLDVPGAKVYFRSLLRETLKEVKLMQALESCETVVRYEDSMVRKLDDKGEFGWIVLIRMEYLVPFRKCLLKGISISDVVRLGIDISLALDACEQKGIVHRDIKPDNLFYSPASGRYKLGDFGIAHDLAHPTEGKGRAGTLTHMSPEVYQGAAYTASADLYALGMILYCLLNQNRVPLLPPFPIPFTPAERDCALLRRLRGVAPEMPGIVSCAEGGKIEPGFGVSFDENTRSAAVALGKIARKQISANPEDRYPSATVLRTALEAVWNPAAMKLPQF